MRDAAGEATTRIATWAINERAHYDALLAAAEDGPAALENYVRDLFANAKDGDGHVRETAREVGVRGLARVRWAEVAEALTG
jgi:hypothetical protein